MTKASLSLADCPFLAEVDQAAIDRLTLTGRVRTIALGERVFCHGDSSDAVYFLLKGNVRILSRDQGRPVPLVDLLPGDFFGELAAIDGLQRTGDAVATNHVEVFECPREGFLMLLVENPFLGLRLLARFSSMIRRADIRISALAALSPDQRVSFALLDLALPDADGSGGWTISPAPQMQDVASWAGTTEAIATGTLEQLMKSGLLHRRDRDLQIADRAKIQALIQQD